MQYFYDFGFFFLQNYKICPCYFIIVTRTTTHVGRHIVYMFFFQATLKTTCTNVNMYFPFNGSNYKLFNFMIKVVVNYIDNVVNFINITFQFASGLCYVMANFQL
jgi:hypothetical protein